MIEARVRDPRTFPGLPAPVSGVTWGLATLDASSETLYLLTVPGHLLPGIIGIIAIKSHILSDYPRPLCVSLNEVTHSVRARFQ